MYGQTDQGQAFIQVVNHEWDRIPFGDSFFPSNKMNAEWDKCSDSLLRMPEFSSFMGELASSLGFVPLHIF